MRIFLHLKLLLLVLMLTYHNDIISIVLQAFNVEQVYLNMERQQLRDYCHDDIAERLLQKSELAMYFNREKMTQTQMNKHRTSYIVVLLIQVRDIEQCTKCSTYTLTNECEEKKMFSLCVRKFDFYEECCDNCR